MMQYPLDMTPYFCHYFISTKDDNAWSEKLTLEMFSYWQYIDMQMLKYATAARLEISLVMRNKHLSWLGRPNLRYNIWH